METTYKVVYLGEVVDGFNLNQVEENFARLFGISSDQATAYLKPNKIIKKDLALERANVYRDKLEKCGMLVKVEPEQPTFASQDFEVEPIEDEQKQATNPSLPFTDSASSSALSFDMNTLSVEGIEDRSQESAESSHHFDQNENNSEMFRCPKCGTEQIKSNQCINFSCGIYFHKFQQSQENNVYEESNTDGVVESDEDQLTFFEKNKPIFAAMFVAVAGAVLWAYIIGALHREFSWLAILIGGGIGLAAASINTHYRDVRIVCVILVVCSVIGGKYIAIQYFKSYIINEVNTLYTQIPEPMREQIILESINGPEIDAYYEMMKNQDQIKAVLIAYLESEGAGVATPIVDDYIFEYFDEHVTPFYDFVRYEDPSFQEIERRIFEVTESFVRDFPNFYIIRVSFNGLGILFLIIGMGLAFHAARPSY